jgi:glyoxylase-like metal-dependent hydrolase (beta-lactamase superfamily II)
MRTTLAGAPSAFEGGLLPLGSGTWAWIQPDGGWGEANAGLVVGDGASAVIDTLWDQRRCREMLGAMAAPTVGAPVELAINTHADGDHWWGNAELPAAARIVTSAEARTAMDEEETPRGMARLRRLTGLTGRLPGRGGEMGRYVRGMLEPFDFRHVDLRLPDDVFHGSATEHVGGRELGLRMLGPAHTVGDLVVHVPDAGVLFAADLLFVGVTPVMWAGPVDSWIEALDAILAMDADTIVPGHGPVGGPDEVRAMRDYWTWLDQAVAAQHRMGHRALEATIAVLRDPDAASWRRWLVPERTLISVTVMQRQLAGEGPLPRTTAVRAALFDQVASVRRALGDGGG